MFIKENKTDTGWYWYGYVGEMSPSHRNGDYAVLVSSDRYVWAEGCQWTKADIRWQGGVFTRSAAVQFKVLMEAAMVKMDEMDGAHGFL